jgi:hypothetical protein
MVDEKYIEIMNRRIDGVATNEEIDILDEYLAKNEEARIHYDNLRRVAETLDNVEKVEAPADMKSNILNSINANQKPARVVQRYGMRDLISVVSNWIEYKTAVSFAAGAVAAVLVAALYLGGVDKITSQDERWMTGSMVVENISDETVLLEESYFDINKVGGSVNLKRVGDIFTIELDIEADIKAGVMISFDQDQLAVAGFEQRANVGPDVQIFIDGLKITHFGENTYRFFLRPLTLTDSRVKLRIFAGDQSYQKNLDCLIPVTGN